MRYLSEVELIEINEMLIRRFSPAEQIGVQQPESLSMTVAQPKQVVFDQDLYPSVYEKAAIIFINLCKKHIFFNANKRTALVVMELFFQLNGFKLVMSNDEKVQFTLNVATDQRGFDELKKLVVKRFEESVEKKS